MRSALSAAVGVVSGLQVFDHVPDSVDPPVFIAGEVELTYDDVPEGGYDEMRITCHLYTSTSDTSPGQQLLDGYLSRVGPTSIKQAIEADRTLGGTVHTLIVERITGYGKYRIGSLAQPEVRYYGARMFVRVWGS